MDAPATLFLAEYGAVMLTFVHDDTAAAGRLDYFVRVTAPASAAFGAGA